MRKKIWVWFLECGNYRFDDKRAIVLLSIRKDEPSIGIQTTVDSSITDFVHTIYSRTDYVHMH